MVSIVIFIIGLPLLFIVVPTILAYRLEKITNKKVTTTTFNTRVDESQGRAQAITVYKTNFKEGGDRI